MVPVAPVTQETKRAHLRVPGKHSWLSRAEVGVEEGRRMGGLQIKVHATVVFPETTGLEREGFLSQAAGEQREPSAWRPEGELTQRLAPFPRDLTDFFPCVCFAFRQLLLPLFLAVLISHLHFMIYL